VSPGGKPGGWRYDAVKTILENVAYTGTVASSQGNKSKYHHIEGDRVVEGGGRRRRPKEDWIIHPDRHEALIDLETFAKAQALLARSRGHAPYTDDNNPYLLSGKLRCGRCGCAMQGLTHHGARRYECGRRREARHAGVARSCEGTRLREDEILRSIADYLYREFEFASGGEDPMGLGWRAERKELEPGDLPEAFAKVKQLVTPPHQPAGDRKRLEKQSKALAEKVEKMRRNLIHLDPEYIPDAQKEIRRLEAERVELEADLRKRPPSTADVNARATALLRSLYWMALYFRLAADPMDPEKQLAEEGRACGLGGDFRPEVRHHLRAVSAITIHTRKKGRGAGTRYRFDWGEICFGGAEGVLGPVGGVTASPRPSRRLPSRTRRSRHSGWNSSSATWRSRPLRPNRRPGVPWSTTAARTRPSRTIPWRATTWPGPT
jgi:hypothetical protein